MRALINNALLPGLFLLLISSIYLTYIGDYCVTVPDSWPLIERCARIIEGDVRTLEPVFLDRRPLTILYYTLNALWISLLGLKGIYFNVFLHMFTCSVLLFFYLRKWTGYLVGLCTSLLFLLYPSLTSQSAAYMCNYYQGLSFSLLALLLIEKSLFLSALCLFMSFWTVESPGIIYLIHPFLISSDFYRHLRRTVGVFFGVMSVYATWRFFLFPIYYQDIDGLGQTTVGLARYAFHFIRGIDVTYIVSHVTLFEYLSYISFPHLMVGLLGALIFFFFLTRVIEPRSTLIELQWIYVFEKKYVELVEGINQNEKLLNLALKSLHLIFPLIGVLLLLLGYVIDVEFAKDSFSEDRVLDQSTRLEINFMRCGAVICGFTCIVLSFWRFKKFDPLRITPTTGTRSPYANKVKSHHLLGLSLVGVIFVLLGYVYSLYRPATPSANVLGEYSRYNFAALIGACLSLASLFAWSLQTRLGKLAHIGFSIYVGILIAYRFQLQHDTASMGKMQRDIWNQIIRQVPDLNGRVCLILEIADTVNVRAKNYLNDWDNTPDIPTRLECPLTPVRAFNGITWGENVALSLLYGPAGESQVLLLTPEEVKAFMADQKKVLGLFQELFRGVRIDAPYSPGQIVLFEYDSSTAVRKNSYAFQDDGHSVQLEGLGAEAVGAELQDSKMSQRKMRELLLRN